ncbi:MAG: phosphoenolpyruvate--protein phosphotransferase [Sumerlaeia bacterium]
MAGKRTFHFDGLGVSDGIAIGPAYVIDTKNSQLESYHLAADEVESEILRFRQAIEMAKEEVAAIGRQVAEKIDPQQAKIFDAHLAMLDDPYLIDPAISRIREEQRNAESIFWSVTKGLGDQMAALGDDYFAERNHDLYDVARRVIKFLGELSPTAGQSIPRDGCIVIASDLGPAETAQFSRNHAIGFCTDEGGPTSHTAILARALAIPAIVGLEFVTHYIRTGDLVIMDGSAGKLILNPSKEQLEFYEAKRQDHMRLREDLLKLRELPAITTDGVRIAMMANLEFPDELDALENHGAEGIGLFRTEFLYLNGRGSASEAEHYESYVAVLQRMGNLPVVMRTMDIGGDKVHDSNFTPFQEANPFLGLRAIRLCLKRPELFRSQLRSMLAAASGMEHVRIMLPMISSIDEVRAARVILHECLDDQRAAGKEVPPNIHLGIMVEVPSVAILADTFAREVDFFSIGTNDLVQYTLAVDRINKSVAHLYRPTHPAVLRLIKMVADAGKAHGIPVSVCGEMASRPSLAVLLIGLGLRTLSMGPSSISAVKRAIRSVNMADLEELAQSVLLLSSAEEVEELLAERAGYWFSRPTEPPETVTSNQANSA